MNQVFKYIKDYYTKEFNIFYLLLIMAMLGILIYFNYWHGLERKYGATVKSKWLAFAGYYLIYFVPFAAAFLLQVFFYKDAGYYKHTWFWIILFLAPAIFSFRVTFWYHIPWIKETFTRDYSLYLHCINWIVKLFALLIPVYIIWLIKDKNNQPFYGLMPMHQWKPYIIMILVMVPLIALASTQKDFLQVYPKAKMIGQIPMHTWADKWRYLLFELCYGFDFISMEFFFRGFLILSLVNICGTHCIIPVACFYCAIHFGKPMGEAISSFFGGILLGIVCYNTKSVWGGLLVHLGIAWLMEIGGFLGALLAKAR